MHMEPFWEDMAVLISNFHSRQRAPLTVFLSPLSLRAWPTMVYISGSRSRTVPRAMLSQYHAAEKRGPTAPVFSHDPSLLRMYLCSPTRYTSSFISEAGSALACAES